MAKTKGKPAAKKTAKAAARAPLRAAQPAKAAKPAKSTAPTLAAPPAPPPPPPAREELAAPRDVARLTRYGERFGPHKIDVRLLPQQLPVSSGMLAIVDPGNPKSWRVFDRPVGAGHFRVMVSIARTDVPATLGTEKLAAVVVHVGRPPIAKWTVAHYHGQKPPKSPEQLPRCAVTTGWIALIDAGAGSPGVIAVPQTAAQPIEVTLVDSRRALALALGNGEYAAYWAVDAADKPICLVLDFDVFTQKEWKARAT